MRGRRRRRPEKAVAALGEFELGASTIVSSGSPAHVHAYWLLAEPIAPALAERLLVAIAERLGGDRAVTHCNQVMRLPGTLNHKTDPPGSVKFVQTNDRRFRAQEFVIEGDFPASLLLCGIVPVIGCGANR